MKEKKSNGNILRGMRLGVALCAILFASAALAQSEPPDPPCQQFGDSSTILRETGITFEGDRFFINVLQQCDGQIMSAWMHLDDPYLDTVHAQLLMVQKDPNAFQVTLCVVQEGDYNAGELKVLRIVAALQRHRNVAEAAGLRILLQNRHL